MEEKRSSNDFDELAKSERLLYFKNWRLRNKDKVRQHNKNYWRRKAEKKFLEVKNTDE